MIQNESWFSSAIYHFPTCTLRRIVYIHTEMCMCICVTSTYTWLLVCVYVCIHFKWTQPATTLNFQGCAQCSMFGRGEVCWRGTCQRTRVCFGEFVNPALFGRCASIAKCLSGVEVIAFAVPLPNTARQENMPWSWAIGEDQAKGCWAPSNPWELQLTSWGKLIFWWWEPQDKLNARVC